MFIVTHHPTYAHAYAHTHTCTHALVPAPEHGTCTGDTFARVSEVRLPDWRKEQVSIILDEQFLTSAAVCAKLVPSCLFVLMYATELDRYQEDAAAAAEAEESTVEALQAVEARAAEQRAALRKQVDTLATEVGSRLDDLEQRVQQRMARFQDCVDDLGEKLDLVLKKLK